MGEQTTRTSKVSFRWHPEQDDPYKHSQNVLSHFHVCRIIFSHWRRHVNWMWMFLFKRFHPLLCHQSVQVFNCLNVVPWLLSSWKKLFKRYAQSHCVHLDCCSVLQMHSIIHEAYDAILFPWRLAINQLCWQDYARHDVIFVTIPHCITSELLSQKIIFVSCNRENVPSLFHGTYLKKQTKQNIKTACVCL